MLKEIICIAGTCNSGKTSKLIRDYICDNCVIISNECTEEYLHTRIKDLTPNNFINLSVVACKYDEDLEGCIPSNATTVLLDGIISFDTIQVIVDKYPSVSKIVWTTQLMRNGFLPKQSKG